MMIPCIMYAALVLAGAVIGAVLWQCHVIRRDAVRNLGGFGDA